MQALLPLGAHVASCNNKVKHDSVHPACTVSGRRDALLGCLSIHSSHRSAARLLLITHLHESDLDLSVAGRFHLAIISRAQKTLPPLHLAASLGHLGCLVALITGGADVNAALFENDEEAREMFDCAMPGTTTLHSAFKW